MKNRAIASSLQLKRSIALAVAGSGFALLFTSMLLLISDIPLWLKGGALGSLTLFLSISIYRRINNLISWYEQNDQQMTRALDEMLAVVSHDLRNPLAALQLNGENILGKIGRPVTGKELSIGQSAKSIIRTSMRMKGLIADILDKVRLDSGTFAIYRKQKNLKIFMDEMVEIFSPLGREKGLQFKIEQKGTDTIVELDFERLFQILSNLIGNAFKFTSYPGKVSLCCQVETDKVCFQVKDTGVGIEKASLDKIFTKYWQERKTGRLGIGLGLSIVRELVEAHGGNIRVDSTEGVGTNFSIEIPIVLTSLPGESHHHLVRKENEERTLFVVEDDDDLREVLEMNLRSLNYKVIAFPNGAQAISSAKSLKVTPDLMIMDYRLPDINGGEVVQEIRSSPKMKNVPVIFLSAETHLDLIASHYEHSAFMTKPLRFKDLQSLIENSMV